MDGDDYKVPRPSVLLEQSITYKDQTVKRDMNRIQGMADKEVWQKMADDLAAEAVRRRCGDNVSVILLRLHE
ncbi:hypothetical protein OSTOST_09025 [Ostertagia ostertagi]